ncbi:MAG: cold shock domain-containing protein [Magnetococcales bacterium]|nr:cold shock domain-containing protein [Magnetococcales bacterium]
MSPLKRIFLIARIHNATQQQESLPEAEWIHTFSTFFDMVREVVKGHGGTPIKLMGPGVICSFQEATPAVKAAIHLQEMLQKERNNDGLDLCCKVGISAGEVFEYAIDGGPPDYIGLPLQIASDLCRLARGNAIILTEEAYQETHLEEIRSRGGDLTKRRNAEYFQKEPARRLQGVQMPVSCHSLFWQAKGGEYLTHSPMEESQGDINPEQTQGIVYFGKVSAFKRERGFGFIQYYDENQEYKEIYFHMTYVINQTPVREHDDVQFVIKPGKGGRPQACSVIVMGGRLQGQVESFDPRTGGFITIRDHDSEVIKFFMLPNESHHPDFLSNDIVEFTVSSGSDMEGLTATNVQYFNGEHPPHLAGSGDNLTIGSQEQAMITVYFPEKGYGFAKCRRNNIYLHVSEFVDPEADPQPGALIQFEVFPGRNGTYRANDISFVTDEEPALASSSDRESA